MKYVVVAVNDEHDVCSLCGKQNLRRVVWVSKIKKDGTMEDPEPYGTTCYRKLLRENHQSARGIKGRLDNLYKKQQFFNDLLRKHHVVEAIGKFRSHTDWTFDDISLDGVISWNKGKNFIVIPKPDQEEIKETIKLMNLYHGPSYIFWGKLYIQLYFMELLEKYSLEYAMEYVFSKYKLTHQFTAPNGKIFYNGSDCDKMEMSSYCFIFIPGTL